MNATGLKNPGPPPVPLRRQSSAAGVQRLRGVSWGAVASEDSRSIDGPAQRDTGGGEGGRGEGGPLVSLRPASLQVSLLRLKRCLAGSASSVSTSSSGAAANHNGFSNRRPKSSSSSSAATQSQLVSHMRMAAGENDQGLDGPLVALASPHLVAAAAASKKAETEQVLWWPPEDPWRIQRGSNLSVSL